MKEFIISERTKDIDLERPSIPIMWITEFGTDDAQDFFMNFVALQSNGDVNTIFLYVDSFGGAIDSLSTMIELIESSPKPVATVCIGKAFSAGAMLVALGHKGMRWVAPNSRLMFHRVALAISGDDEQMSAPSLNNTAKELLRINDTWLKKVVARSDMTWTEFNKELDAHGGEWYLTANEAQERGFVDHVGIPIVKEVYQTRVEVYEKTPRRKKKTAKKVTGKIRTKKVARKPRR